MVLREHKKDEAHERCSQEMVTRKHVENGAVKLRHHAWILAKEGTSPSGWVSGVQKGLWVRSEIIERTCG